MLLVACSKLVILNLFAVWAGTTPSTGLILLVNPVWWPGHEQWGPSQLHGEGLRDGEGGGGGQPGPDPTSRGKGTWPGTREGARPGPTERREVAQLQTGLVE